MANEQQSTDNSSESHYMAPVLSSPRMWWPRGAMNMDHARIFGLEYYERLVALFAELSKMVEAWAAANPADGVTAQSGEAQIDPAAMRIAPAGMLIRAANTQGDLSPSGEPHISAQQ